MGHSAHRAAWHHEGVRPRLDALLQPPIAFAHRGARAHAPENTIEAFQLARRLGATGLESDVWLTADGQAVLDHDGVVGGRLRKRRINDIPRAELPSHIPTLDEFYDQVGVDLPLSLDVKDPEAALHAIAIARDHHAEDRLWLCHPSWELVATWRPLSDGIKLVDSTRIGAISEGPERRAAALRHAGIDALNLHWRDWSGGLVTLVHRFERYALGWDAQFERSLGELLDAGIDGVFSDHTDVMMEMLDRYYPNRAKGSGSAPPSP
jgi:glycerophosphoryl diester phosphodiesterase